MNTPISISKELAELCKDVSLGVLEYSAGVAPSAPALLGLFDERAQAIAAGCQVEDIVKNPHIAATREAYKKLGKDPHAYRNAAEAMLRRIVKGKGLYRINNVVDVNNLISVSSGYSIGSYDTAALSGRIELRRAEDGAHYDGIGKSSVNIEHLPTLYDGAGPFGNPTSDSQRACIQEGTKKILSVLYAFDGAKDLPAWMNAFALLLKQHCGASRIRLWVI